MDGSFYDEAATFVVFPLMVLNPGQQSIAWRWKCTAILVGGQPTHADALWSIADMKDAVREARTKEPVVIEASKYLPSVLRQKPLAEGEARDGWAIFKFKADLSSELIRPSVKYTIKFENATGQVTELEWVVDVGYFENARKPITK